MKMVCSRKTILGESFFDKHNISIKPKYIDRREIKFNLTGYD